MAPREALLFFCPEWNGMHPGAWRYGAAPADGAIDIQEIRRLVSAAERAKFHAFFLADALGFRLEISYEALSRTAAAARLEPFTLMAALTASTRRIGLILTAHTTYDQPYHLARRFASLDHISGGRAGWNVVTGGFARGAAHFGRIRHVPHDERYREGEEVLEAVTELWDSWEDDAFLRDQDSGIFFDPAKLHVGTHQGEYATVTGPLSLPRPLQGHPVIAQAGSSPAGREFAARHGEVIFTLQPTLDAGQRFYAEIKELAARAGRNPDHIKVLPSLTLVLGETEDEAAEKAAALDALADPRVGIELLGAFLGADLSACPLDDRLPEIALTDTGTQTVQRFFIEKAERERLTIRELIPAALGFGAVTATPAAIADRIEEWVQADAADGFNVTFADLPDSMNLFCRQVIPELQRRGVFHREYRGQTLRENLGLPRPANPHAPPAGDPYSLPLVSPGASGARQRQTFLEAGTPMRF